MLSIPGDFTPKVNRPVIIFGVRFKYPQGYTYNMVKKKLTLYINDSTISDVKRTGVNISELVGNYLNDFLRSRSYKDAKLPHRPVLSRDDSRLVFKKDLSLYVEFRGTEGVSRSWLYQIRWILNNYCNYCNYRLDKEKTIRYLNKIRSKYSVSFYRKQVLQIRAFLRYLGITWLDTLKVISEPYYTPKVITRDIVESALAYFKDNLQCRAIILLGASSGLRPHELYQLTPKDIDVEGRIVHVAHRTKTGRTRISFFNETCHRALKPFLEQNRFKYLFGESHMLRAFRGSPILVKDLRKYFAQEWLRREGNVIALEQLLGHSTKKNILMSHYAIYTKGELQGIYDRVFSEKE